MYRSATAQVVSSVVLNELNKGGSDQRRRKRVDGKTLDEQMKKYDITDTEIDAEADRIYHSAPGRKFSTQMGSQDAQWESLDIDRAEGCIRDLEHAYTKDGGLAVLFGNIAQNGCVVKTAGVDPVLWHFEGPAYALILRKMHAKASSAERLTQATA